MINSLAIGLAFAFLVLRIFNRRQESNLTLFIAVAICDIISACVGRAYGAAFAASGLTFPVMADTANTAATILLLQRAFQRFGLRPLAAVINQQENR